MMFNLIDAGFLSGRRNEWCFLCELQIHLERANHSANPFSPMNILSRLPNLGGNLGYGRQEDAHEFMRFPANMFWILFCVILSHHIEM